MRHGKKFNHLSRTKSHRKAMLSNMACSLIEHKRINTTVAKAKALRGFVEPLITKSKNDTTHSRRVVFSYLNNKFAVAELFRDVAPKVGERPGGYTRIIKTGNRLGDNAEMCMMELVDFNDLYVSEEKKPTKKRRRRRGSGKSTSSNDAKAESQEVVAKDADVTDKAETSKEEEKENTPKVEAKKKDEEKKDGDEKKGEEKKD